MLLGGALVLTSCVPPKAIVVEAASAPAPKEVEKAPEPVAPEPLEPPPLPNDGLRMPDMLAMPGDDDFRATNPSTKTGEDAGAVISRPPTDPPSRVKPKATGP